MEIDLARELMKYFFQAPTANGILVFEDNEYLGIVLKKDIEFGIATGNFNLFENINMVKPVDLIQIISKDNKKRNVKIPVIDKSGKLIRIITYEEFNSQFNFEEFEQTFKIPSVIDYLEYPLIITNCFKKCLYANKNAFELAGFDIPGKKITSLLKKFEIKKFENGLLLEKDNKIYHLVISKSESKNFLYFVYNFLSFNE